MCTHAIKHEVKHFANRESAILASDMAPVVTGPKRTNKKGEYIYKLSLSPKGNTIAVVLTGPHWSVGFTFHPPKGPADINRPARQSFGAVLVVLSSPPTSTY